MSGDTSSRRDAARVDSATPVVGDLPVMAAEPERTFPTAGMLALGSVLLGALLTVVWGWLLIHIGPVIGSVIAAGFSLAMVPFAFYDAEATETRKRLFTRTLARRHTHLVLCVTLVAAVLLGGTITSVQISGDAAVEGTELWIESHSHSGEAKHTAERHRISTAGPVRRIGLAFSQVPRIYSVEYRLEKKEAMRPFLPRRYRYPDDFEPRFVLTIVPDGALFYSFLRREYRVRILDTEGSVIADTILGGPSRKYSLSIDGQLPEGILEARAYAEQPERDSTELRQRLARWKQGVSVESGRQLRKNERLRV